MTHPTVSLPFALERELVIRAPRRVVFRYFTDSARFAAWWGAGSTIEGRTGGAVRIVYPNNVVATGTVLALEPERRIVFSYGYEAAGGAIPPGGSRVSITLEEVPEGTRLKLVHEVHDAAVRDHHVQGWRYQLSLFANIVARELFADGAEAADRWFAAWNEPDDARRRVAFGALTTDDVAFADAYSALRGRADLEAHAAASKVHMPGIVLAREGAARQCQGMVLADWTARAADGTTVGRGTNVFELDPAGRIARAVGLWAAR
jgi:uncharacterized protein YndB with AHSA1/START domain